nr:protein NYNRIN-like [Coffea arabica]
MDPIVRYLAQGELPPSRIEARKILLKSQKYTLAQGVLYRKSYLQPWLKCITPEEGGYVLRELHEGICGNHVGTRVLAKKGMLAGYYWPTIFRDSAELVARSIDYFTKWVEAEPLGTISSRSIQKFLWKGIICRFGIPRALVSDNGRQFADRSLQEWCTELGIQQHFTSVGHPQANGQVENVNRTILHGLKTRIESARTGWLDELPTILWAYRTTPRTATQETPFALAYGMEAVIPAEIGMPSSRVQHFVAQSNEEGMRLDLDLLEHRREKAAIRMAKYKGQVARYYNARVRHLSFKPGDLMLHKNSVSRAVGTGKLDLNWEGPYVVKEADRTGYCKLARLEGGEVPRTWHNSNLRLFL